MYPPTHKSLVRPRSSLSTTEENRLKPGLGRSAKWCRPSLTVLSLAGACAFLFVLCLCLVCALVVVGRNFARGGPPAVAIQPAAGGSVKSVNSANVIGETRTVIQTVEDAAGKQTQISRIPKAVQPIDPVDLQDVTLLSSDRYWDLINSRQKVVFRPGKVPPLRDDDSESDDSVKSVQFATKSAGKGSTTAVMSKVIPKLTFRLPAFIKPREYNLWLHPHLDSKRFTGKVSIELDVQQPTAFIPLHSKRLNITATSVFRVQKDGSTVPVKVLQTFAYDPHEYWVTEFEKPIEPATYHMKLSFEGSLTDRIVGLYQSSYLDTKTKKRR